jgi:hypothetical protein
MCIHLSEFLAFYFSSIGDSDEVSTRTLRFRLNTHPDRETESTELRVVSTAACVDHMNHDIP